MRKALILIVLPSFLSSLSIAEGNTHGKTPLSTPRNSSIVLAQVRVVPLPLLHVVSQPDILPSDQIFLDRVLRTAPAICRESIEHLVVRYDKDAERGQATASTMILRGPLASLSRAEQSEMIGVIFHECGHIVDLGALGGSSISGVSAYPDGHVPTFNDDPSRLFYEISWETPTKLRSNARGADFVSGYAKKGDAFEDLAESFVYFALHERAFRERAAANPALARKLRWLETYVFVDGQSPTPSEGWDGTIAWDVTKLTHMLEF